MKARILELISTPENIVAEDLPLLKDEITVQPYAQSLRALYLLGTKKYDEENYQKVLATTAAYTTDKKILYQFINGKIFETSSSKTISENLHPQPIVEEIIIKNKDAAPVIEDKMDADSNDIAEIPENSDPQPREEEIIIENKDAASVIEKKMDADGNETAEIPENPDPQLREEKIIIKNKDAAPVIEDEIDADSNYFCEIPERIVPEKVIVEGVVNRILFEGEENFLEEETVKIDLEATEESGVLVTEKKADVGQENNLSSPIIEKSPEKFKEDLLSLKSEFGKEKSIEEINNPEKTTVEFRELENGEIENRILDPEPEVKKEQNTTIIKIENRAENKYETERKKLAEEIERKISHRKKQPGQTRVEEESVDQDANVDFHQTQEFAVESTKQDENVGEEKNLDTNAEAFSVQNIEKNDTDKSESELSPNSEWKPMNQADKTSVKSRFSDAEKATALQKPELITEVEIEDTPDKEVKPLNISFFAPTIAENIAKKTAEVPAAASVESNIPSFINTWQNWLKLDHTEAKSSEEPIISKEKIKSEAIEKFIDTAPKISKLKEDVSFTVKEKKDDINHLMTETLAKLFLTQKLYSKAIKAYKTLQEKHPEKAKEFELRIEEIKALRQK